MPTLVKGLLLLALVALALVALARLRPVVGYPLFYLTLASSILFWSTQATSWNVLSGYSGYFSFGQGAFVGVGAYATAVLAGRHGVGFFATLPVAALLSVALALLVGAVAFRLRSLRGEIFALLTLATPFILAALARINAAIDGGQGIVLRVPEFPDWVGSFQDFLFLLNLLVGVVAIGFAFGVQHSRFGWALAAVRDAEDVAEGLGVATFRYKLLAMVAGGLIGGVSGSVYALQIGFVTVEAVFGLTIPLFVIVMSVLGGRTHWLGPVVGAVVIVTLQDRLASAGQERWRLIILGAILATLVVVAPEGLLTRLRSRPLVTAATLAGVTVLLGLLGVWGEPLDWLAAGMLAAVVTALVRRPARRPRQPSGDAAPDALPVAAAGAAGTGTAEPGTGTAESGTRTAAAGTAVAPAAGGREALAGGLAAVAGDGRASDGAVLVECVDVARHFGGVRALDGVSLQIRAGELVGLVGPNGSGKTTLVNLLAGAIRPTRGTIRVAGRDLAGLPPHRVAHAGVSRTYQIPRPFDSMTVRDNVAMAIMFGRAPRRLDDARRVADGHLALVGLGRLGGALPAALNLHQRQLLEMARAIATAPKVLLLDEALAGLNPVEIDDAVEVVRRIHASGIAIVIVEHLLRVVNQLATRVVVLDRGRCLADGDPSTVMRDPAVVRAYLGKQAHA